MVNNRKIYNLFQNENACSLWIEKQVSRLSKLLDLEIEITQREFRVGDFRADMYGIEHFSDKNIIIEIQQGRSDHKHLGQLLTYVGNNPRSIAIWIAESFREEHLAALKFLNQNNQNSRFYGVEVIQNGQSREPEFKPKIKPNIKNPKKISIEERRNNLMRLLSNEASKTNYKIKFYNSEFLLIESNNKKLNYQIKFHDYYNDTLICSCIVDCSSLFLNKNNYNGSDFNHFLYLKSGLLQEAHIIVHKIGNTSRIKLSADLLDQGQPDSDKIDWVIKTIKIFKDLLE